MSDTDVVAPAHPCSQAGERVWRAACELFARQGIRAVGVAEIAERSGVAKPNLYRNFTSKDGLVVAYLQAQGDRECAVVHAAAAAHPHDPPAAVRQVLDRYAAALRAPGYRGCALLTAAVEFPEADHPVHRAARAQEARLLAALTHLTGDGAVARSLRMVLAGAASAALVDDPHEVVATLERLVTGIVPALPPPTLPDAPARADAPPTPRAQVGPGPAR